MAGLFCFADPGHPAGYSGATSRSLRDWRCHSCIRLSATTELTHRFRRVIDVNNSKRSRFPYLAKLRTPSFSSGTTRVHAPLAHSKNVSQGGLGGANFTQTAFPSQEWLFFPECGPAQIQHEFLDFYASFLYFMISR